MVHLTIRTPDLIDPITVSVSAETVVLVGRTPDVSKLDQQRMGPTQCPILPVSVPSARVSANHLLVYASTLGTWIQDLHSRNGSWLRLVPGQPAALPADVSLSVDLTGTAPNDPRIAGPENANWSAAEEYGEAVLRQVDTWFRRLGITADLDLIADGSSGDDAKRFPLANGAELRLRLPATATQDVQWPWVLEQARSYVAEQNALFEQEQGHEEDFILASPLLREAHRKLAEAAMRGIRVMLLGPTGVGKERLARCYHQHSRQPKGPFKSLNCGQLTEDLMYAQIFGAKRGSFTGCTADITGAVEWASGGTLFLDEVGEMNVEVQKALLRFLDRHGEYDRLGDPQPRRAKNVQIVCATNADIEESMRGGKFREDLWYRLAVKVIRIPPLRERREDIVAYLQARQLASGTPVFAALMPEAVELVLADPWPGNFRDLENFVERLPEGAAPRSIDAASCRAALAEGRAHKGVRSPDPQPAGSVDEDEWQAVMTAAARAFAEDQGGSPRSWGQVEAFMERYLKPVFVAHALGLQDVEEPGRGFNYSAMARRLHIADGTTVRNQLRRYVERFRKR